MSTLSVVHSNLSAHDFAALVLRVYSWNFPPMSIFAMSSMYDYDDVSVGNAVASWALYTELEES